MKNQFLLIGLVAAGITPPPFVFGATYFLPGVSVDSGWHDAEKVFGGVDDNLCWAAQSANMAQYWQDWYVKAGNELPASTPNSAGEIFDLFKSSWSNQGSICEFGLPWYFTGMTPMEYYNDGYYRNPDFSTLLNTSYQGYFKHLYSYGRTYSYADDFMAKEGLLLHQWQGNMSIGDFTETLIELITVKNSIVGLSLDFWKLDGSGLGGAHAVTLWGFETTEVDGVEEVCKIYITDSDDGQNALVCYDVNGRARLGYDVELPNFHDEVTGEYYSTSIDSFYSLSVDRFVAVIPEPSAFGLLSGIAALAVVSAQRRRSRRLQQKQ